MRKRRILDMFGEDETIQRENNLVYVNRGKTVLKLQNTNILAGIVVTVLGVVLSWFLIAFVKRKQYDEITIKEN